MARRQREMLADVRAMEEQEERTNPLNPKAQIGAEKGYTGILKGKGATPSMGLSTKRGGARRRSVEEAVVELEGGAMGKALGEHLLSLKGRGFYDEFTKGMSGVINPLEGGGYLDRMVGGAETGAYKGEGTKKGMMRKTSRKAYEGLHGGAYTITRSGSASGKESFVVSENGRKLGEFDTMKEAQAFVMTLRKTRPMGTALTVPSDSGPDAEVSRIFEVAPHSSSSSSSAAPRRPLSLASLSITPEAMGHRGEDRMARPTTPTDQPTNKSMPKGPKKKGMGKLTITHGGGKRAARGEMVKRVMREHGLSLGEASKYIKEHGL